MIELEPTSREPGVLAAQADARPTLPPGNEERFAGYGVMACPFSSGHILCHRRFSASSVGPAYTAIWHFHPTRGWTFFQDAPPMQACTRYFGDAVSEARQVEIVTDWRDGRHLHLAIPGKLDWEMTLRSSAMTRAMNTMGQVMPERAWRSAAVLRAMGWLANATMKTGHLQLSGHVPNGQSFVSNPLLVWSISESRAVVDGEDLGTLQPSRTQERLGDFWVPRAPLFAVGRAFFEPYDPARHHAFDAANHPRSPSRSSPT